MTCLDPYLSMAATEASVEPSLACCDRPRAILLGYLFGAFNLAELQSRLERVFGFGFERSVRSQMVADRRVMCVMKFALYQTVAARHRYRTLPELRRYALSVGLPEEDLPLIALVINHAGLSAHFDNLLDSGFKSMSYAKFSIEINRAIVTNEVNTKRYAYAKLRFLSRWGLTQDDAITDCTSRAFEALLLAYPIIKSREHFHNLYKLSIRQAGSKLIAHYTTQGRNVYDENGKSRTDRINAVGQDGNEYSILDVAEDESMSSGLTGGDSHNEEATMVVHQLLTSTELSEQDKQFLTLLAGQTDTAFERWMQDERDVQDVERVINGQTPRYRRLVMEYLRYPTTRLRHIQHLLTHVRTRQQAPIIMQPTVQQAMREAPRFSFAQLAVPARF